MTLSKVQRWHQRNRSFLQMQNLAMIRVMYRSVMKPAPKPGAMKLTLMWKMRIKPTTMSHLALLPKGKISLPVLAQRSKMSQSLRRARSRFANHASLHLADSQSQPEENGLPRQRKISNKVLRVEQHLGSLLLKW